MRHARATGAADPATAAGPGTSPPSRSSQPARAEGGPASPGAAARGPGRRATPPPTPQRQATGGPAVRAPASHQRHPVVGPIEQPRRRCRCSRSSGTSRCSELREPKVIGDDRRGRGRRADAAPPPAPLTTGAAPKPARSDACVAPTPARILATVDEADHEDPDVEFERSRHAPAREVTAPEAFHDRRPPLENLASSVGNRGFGQIVARMQDGEGILDGRARAPGRHSARSRPPRAAAGGSTGTCRTSLSSASAARWTTCASTPATAPPRSPARSRRARSPSAATSSSPRTSTGPARRTGRS